MSVCATQLNAVRGDSNIFDFATAPDQDLVFEVFLVNGTPLVAKTSASGIEWIPEGVRVTLAPGDTLTLAPTLHVLLYRLVGTKDGAVTTLYHGPLYVFATS